MAFGRAFPIRAHVAGSLALPPQPPVPPARIVHAAQSTGRGVYGMVRQGLIRPHLAPPIVALRPPQPSRQTNQAVKRGQMAFAERFLPFRPRLAQPLVARGPPLVVRATIVSQSVAGSRGRRGGGVTSVNWYFPGPVHQGTVVSQAIQRPLSRRGVPELHLAPPLVASSTPVTFIAPPARIVSIRSVERSTKLRGIPQSTLLPAPPFPAITRTPNTANIAALGPFEIRRRDPGSTILPPPMVAPFFTAPPAVVVSDQSVQRALTRRSMPREPLVAAPVLASATPIRPVVITQALVRVRRPAPRPHLASAVVATPATFVAPDGIILSQALRVTRRIVAAPHVAKPVVAPATTFVGPAPFVVTQAIDRASTRRTVPAPHLAPAGKTPAGPAATIQLQAVERAVRRPAPPKPHLAPPIVSQAVVSTPLHPGLIISQAVARSTGHRYRDVPPRPTLAPRVTSPAGPGATIRLQAVARSTRRQLLPAHVATAVSIPIPLSVAVTDTTAIQDTATVTTIPSVSVVATDTTTVLDQSSGLIPVLSIGTADATITSELVAAPFPGPVTASDATSTVDAVALTLPHLAVNTSDAVTCTEGVALFSQVLVVGAQELVSTTETIRIDLLAIAIRQIVNVRDTAVVAMVYRRLELPGDVAPTQRTGVVRGHRQSR